MKTIRDTLQQDQWGRHGNASMQLAAKVVCNNNAAVKKAFFDSCGGSEIVPSSLESLMDQLVLKVFHARAGASLKAWKVSNTSRGVKCSSVLEST